jgi:antitoxin CptB
MNGVSMDLAGELTRLRWQCRRGLLELDLLFSRFLQHSYAALPRASQHDFRRLLEYPDTTLLSWLQGQDEPPEDLINIVNKIIYVTEN